MTLSRRLTVDILWLEKLIQMMEMLMDFHGGFDAWVVKLNNWEQLNGKKR
ncbi:MAG: hypothetical protein H6576_13655 [Lewinellaceae bacterium]|nr:hypothetical protein [Lewinellaceae bacterium]